MIGATNGYDALVALIVGIPATIAAIAGLLAWRNSRAAKNSSVRTEEEMKSPNGTSTGVAVYELQRELNGVKGQVSEVVAGQQRDSRRFVALFEHVGIPDPARDPRL